MLLLKSEVKKEDDWLVLRLLKPNSNKTTYVSPEKENGKLMVK